VRDLRAGVRAGSRLRPLRHVEKDKGEDIATLTLQFSSMALDQAWLSDHLISSRRSCSKSSALASTAPTKRCLRCASIT
jgi:hypothetical protein